MRARICSMICSTFTESERTLKSAISHQLSAVSRLDGPVDDQRDGERPQRHADQQWAVRQQHVGGAAAALALMHQIEVPKNSVQRKWNRQPEPVRTELGLGLGADRVEHV